MVMLYRETQLQAQVLSYGDDFWLLLLCSVAVLALVPFMRRVRAEPAGARRGQQEARDPGLAPAAAEWSSLRLASPTGDPPAALRRPVNGRRAGRPPG